MSISGLKDKLTHSGIYGIGSTESSIEDLLDIEINYTLRVNFSSLINVVDALGELILQWKKDRKLNDFMPMDYLVSKQVRIIWMENAL